MDQLLIFTRTPGAEPAKSRLAASLGPELATAFHEACLMDSVEAGMDAGIESVVVCVSPADTEEQCRDWLLPGLSRVTTSAPALQFRSQSAGSLGERMTNALEQALREADRAILIGSDIPGLGRRQIGWATEELRYSDLVFGPSLDGGYYLVGARAFGSCVPGGEAAAAETLLCELFRDIRWSVPDTLIQVLRRASDLTLSASLIEMWPDLDIADDIPAIRQFLHTFEAAGTSLAPRVTAWLESLQAAS